MNRWTERMRAITIGASFEFDMVNYDSLHGIAMRMKRNGEVYRFNLRGGKCLRTQ